MTALTVTPSWRALAAHYVQIKDVHLRNLFAADPGGAERFCAEGAGLFLDYSSAFMQAFREAIYGLEHAAAERRSRRTGAR